jgi:hypothetical protein
MGEPSMRLPAIASMYTLASMTAIVILTWFFSMPL